MALGAVKIAVLPVFQSVKERPKPPVLLIALIGIAGQAAIDCPDHQTVTEHKKNHVQPSRLASYRYQTGNQPGTQDHHVQPVCTVASGHKAAESCRYLCSKPLKPTADSTHRKITFAYRFLVFYYIAKNAECNCVCIKLTDCLRFH